MARLIRELTHEEDGRRQRLARVMFGLALWSMLGAAALGCGRIDSVRGAPAQTALSTEPPPATAATAPATRPTFRIHGVLLDPDGQPAAGVMVRLEKIMPAGSRPIVVAKMVTGTDGAFRIDGVERHWSYMLIAGSDERGWYYMGLSVDPGRDVDLGTNRLVIIE